MFIGQKEGSLRLETSDLGIVISKNFKDLQDTVF